MTDPWINRLSEYLDDELAPEERAVLEAHLVVCGECPRILEELQLVVTRAGGLDERPPAANLWPGIAGRIGAARGASGAIDLHARRPARRVSFSVPQLLAAGVALAAISGSAVWLAGRSPQPASGPPGAVVGPVEGSAPEVRVVVAAADYDATIAQLEAVLSDHRDQLESTTVDALERSLAAIDQAIVDAEAALAADPASPYLNEHLAGTLRRKIQVLSRAAALVSQVS
jgi:anti-sigma factor RsiW